MALAGYLLWFWSGWLGDEGRGHDGADPARVFRAGKTIKEIVRELHVSRNTVRKVQRSGATEFTYARGVNHDRAFAFFKRACTRGIYDSIKTAVETIFAVKDRLYNRRFPQMCSHFLVDPVACTPASGSKKGEVE